MHLLKARRGETDLIHRGGQWYLSAACDAENSEPVSVSGVLGIDLGVINIATDSDGNIHSSRTVNNVRHRHRTLRTRLQRKGTKSSHRRLKKLTGKESRFGRDVNHTISKEIVLLAQRTKRAIAVEDLTHIRTQVRAKKPQRARLHSWSFAQFRQFINYKAVLYGVPVYLVDPRNTSRTCPICGHISKKNRPSQAAFSCVQCGYPAMLTRSRRSISVAGPLSVGHTSRVLIHREVSSARDKLRLSPSNN